MNRLTVLVIPFVCVAALQTTGAQQSAAQAEKLLASAQHKATIDGDLKGAIEDYKKVVAAAGANRALAAQALVRMAECYQRLGDAEARRVYERVVREFADQKEFVALAEARIGRSETARMTSRRITSVPVGGVGYGTVSPDGRYFPYTNWEYGDLFVRDLVTGTDRRLTNLSAQYAKPSQFSVQAAFSKDGRQIAYGWVVAPKTELRIIDLAGTGLPQPRRLFGSDDVANIWPDDWSPDGKWLAVQLRRVDKTAQMGLVGVHDGVLHILKSVDWRGATRIMFSPDGRYLAYDLPASDTDNRRDVFILATDGSREVKAVADPGNDVVMGWSADGSALLFSSDRTGTVGLWRLRVADGRPNGAPELIKPQIDGAPLGVGKNGALYSLVHHPRFNAAVSADVQVAAFDFETGRLLSPPETAVQRFVGTNNFPTWSPDGKQLAYISMRQTATEGGGAATKNSFIIGIRATQTGHVREMPTGLNLYPPTIRWSADGRSLLTHGRDNKGRQGLFRINVEAETVSVIALSTDDGELRSPSESSDGKRIYYMHGYVGDADREFAVIERDVITGTERELLRERGIFAPGPAPMLSPDGQWILVSTVSPAAQVAALKLVPVRGGQPQEIVQEDLPRRVGLQGWTPDGRAILVAVSDTFQGIGVTAPGAATELWRVPLDGSERRKLDLNVAGMTPFSVHPDGGQIAYGLTERAKDDEVWVLENFLPAPAGKKESTRN
jgi:Tol biopolymer transport system component